jgi:hypothetical protein
MMWWLQKKVARGLCWLTGESLDLSGFEAWNLVDGFIAAVFYVVAVAIVLVVIHPWSG